MPHSTEIDLQSFDISTRNGFLPDELPLELLPDPYYQPWEAIIRNLTNLLKARQLRTTVDLLPILSTSRLTTTPEWRRAYVIFSFLTHAYIWEGPSPAQTLPGQIAIPFLIIADHFDLPTTAAYSATNLWNYAPLTPGLSLCNPDHLRALHTFTGTKDEEWFYMISVAMEARGGAAIPYILKALYASDTGDDSSVADGMLELAKTIDDLAILLDRMYEHCSPEVFYHHIRPMLAGTKNMAVAGLPRGVFYDEGDGKGLWRMYCGGSNAQSSLIQLFDAVLGIEHESAGKPTSKSSNYLQEMRRYMPVRHANFLAHITESYSLRQYTHSRPAMSPVTVAYNTAVASLGALRDRHILIATRYIILPSRQMKSAAFKDDLVNLATASALPKDTLEAKKGSTVLFGTGGTTLIPFLKQVRDDTVHATCG